MPRRLRLRDTAHALGEFAQLDDFIVDGESSDAIVTGEVLEEVIRFWRGLIAWAGVGGGEGGDKWFGG